MDAVNVIQASDIHEPTTDAKKKRRVGALAAGFGGAGLGGKGGLGGAVVTAVPPGLGLPAITAVDGVVLGLLLGSAMAKIAQKAWCRDD